MSGEYGLDTGSDSKVKYIVLGVIVAAFAVGAVVLTRPGDKTQTTAAAKPAADVAQAAPADGTADPAATQAAMTPGANTAMPTTGAAPAAGTDVASASSQQPMPTDAAAMPEPAAMPSPQQDSASNMPMDSSDQSTDSSSTEVAANAEDNKPRPAVREPAAPASDALHAWWRDAATHDFNVQYVGQAANEQALVFRFSKNIANADAAAQHIRVMNENGTVATGAWAAGSNPYVLVYQGVQPGRYTVQIDPSLASAAGNTLGAPLQGPIYVQ